MNKIKNNIINNNFPDNNEYNKLMLGIIMVTDNHLNIFKSFLAFIITNAKANIKTVKTALELMGQVFKLIPRILGRCKVDQLNLVELMLTDQTACITACCTRLPAEACRICRITNRQLIGGDDFIAEHIGHRYLSGRDQI